MRNCRISLIAIIACMLTACVKNEEQITPLGNYMGKWNVADSPLEISIAEFNTTVAITFSRQLASPMPGSITLPYTYTLGDTVRCYSGSIYPDMYFYMAYGTPAGMIEETEEGPTKGQFKPLVKL